MSGLDLVVEIASWIAMISGALFVVIGSMGILRFPDFWSRLHAASITDSAGVILLIIGMCLQAGLTLITVKLVFIGIFLFITGPTATHAVANAAFVSGLRPTNAPEFKPKKRNAKALKKPRKKSLQKLVRKS